MPQGSRWQYRLLNASRWACDARKDSVPGTPIRAVESRRSKLPQGSCSHRDQGTAIASCLSVIRMNRKRLDGRAWEEISPVLWTMKRGIADFGAVPRAGT